MTEEFDQMAKELNEALGVEENASHTQRLVTILQLRVQAARERESRLVLEDITQQRDAAEQKVIRLLNGHARFVGDILSRASAIEDVTDEFHEDLGKRVSGVEFTDAFDLALAQLRERRDDGERHDLDEVEKEFHPDDMRGYNPTFTKDAEEDDSIPGLDPLDLAELEPKPEVRMDFPDTNEEKIGPETTTDFVDERNRVPFNDVEVPLADDTRTWMKKTAAGGARDDS